MYIYYHDDDGIFYDDEIPEKPETGDDDIYYEYDNDDDLPVID